MVPVTVNENIKEIRWVTRLSQKAFAELYGIPISTLRNWEQGSNTLAPYVLGLISRTLPCMNSTLEEIQGKIGVHIFMTKIRIVFWI